MADIRTMNDLVGRSIAERRFVMLLIGAFATLAVLLAAIGIYGVLAYLVTQRVQEIGVRLAIGASPADVVRLFVREGAAAHGDRPRLRPGRRVGRRAGAQLAALRRASHRSVDVCRRGCRARDRGVRRELRPGTPRGARRSDDGVEN